jgi:hypothetical protein
VTVGLIDTTPDIGSAWIRVVTFRFEYGDRGRRGVGVQHFKSWHSDAEEIWFPIG